MKARFISVIAASAIMALSMASMAAAARNPSGTGQPNASCEETSMEPAGFTTDGFAKAETHYAGSDGTPSAMHAASAHAVSQYDVACFQVSQSHP